MLIWRAVDRGGFSKAFSVVRKPLKINGVTSKLATINEKKVGIVVLKSFSTTTNADVTRAMEELHKESSYLV